MNYAVLGASGQTGRGVAAGLLQAGHAVRALARTAAKLEPLAQQGAQVLAGSLEDAGWLTRAFTGVEAVYALLPPNLAAPDFRAYASRAGAAIVAAVQAAGVRHVVSLSSIGAQWPDRTGPIAGLHEQEERLNGLADVHVVHLRAAFFMENLLQQVPAIKSRGLIATPLRGDLPLAMIATRDISRAAVARLLALDFTGHVVCDLLGPRDVSMADAARILGRALGKPRLKYQPVPYPQGEEALRAAGLSPDVARGFIEMYRAFNDGLITIPPRTPANTTPTTLETFADEFAIAFRSRGH